MEKKGKIDNILLLIVFLFSLLEIYICMPIIRVYISGVFQKIVFIGISIIILFLSSTYSKKWFAFFVRKIVPYIIIFLLIYFINIALGRYSVVNDCLSVLDIFMLFFFICIGDFFVTINNKSANKILLFIFILCIFITILTTINGLRINVNYSRMISSSSTQESIVRSIRSLNIGSYDFIYSLIFLIYIFIKTIPVFKKNIYKFALVLLTILSIICVINANFTIAILFLIFTLFCTFISTNISNKKLFLLFIIFILLIIVSRPLLLFILNMFDNYYVSPYMKYKIEGLMNMIEGTSQLSDITSRSYLINNSITTFLNKPLFGCGLYYHDFSIVGGHSQILDDLARYGLFGFFIIVTPIVNYLKNIYPSIKNFKVPMIIFTITFILLSIFNVSLGYTLVLSVFVIVPIWLKNFSIQKEKS